MLTADWILFYKTEILINNIEGIYNTCVFPYRSMRSTLEVLT